jgi:hypothetical protein
MLVVLILHIAVVVLLVSGIAAFAIVLFVRLLREGEIPWTFAGVCGAIVGVASALGIALVTEKSWALQYETSMPAGLFP